MTRRRTDYAIRGLDIRPDDHIQGPSGAPVTLLEYGDYECPYCGEAHPIVKQLQRTLGENMRFIFRNFPLTSVHAHAEEAAEAAESAGAQGKFWEMHDRLYEYQDELAHPHLIGHAQRLGLDVEKFEDELDRHVYMPRVREDFMSGVRGGVNGTPTFFINGVRHDGSYDFETLLEAVQMRIKRSAA
ncbi:MAG TPA: thioredoxin domain-containing protein [Pyrinomonadaceae bacterium]|nr:thioredoxin domain-containing protein [Pyrinomonadaceae bacterium]